MLALDTPPIPAQDEGGTEHQTNLVYSGTLPRQTLVRESKSANLSGLCMSSEKSFLDLEEVVDLHNRSTMLYTAWGM